MDTIESKLYVILLFGIGALILILALFLLKIYRHKRFLKLHTREFQKAGILANDKERMRIAADLHDSIGASLTIIKHKIESIQFHSTEQISARTELISSILKIIEQVRQISLNMMPEVLIDFGLDLALREMIDRKAAAGKMKISFQYDLNYLSDEKSTHLFLVIKEILNNAVKHSNAKNMHVSLRAVKQKITIHIKDDGVGFNRNILERKPNGLGLHTIFTRIAMIDGTVKLDTRPMGGVKYRIQFPEDLMKEN